MKVKKSNKFNLIKDISLVLASGLLTCCNSSTYPYVNRFFYTYSFNLFETGNPRNDSKKVGVNQYFCYKYNKDDKIHYDGHLIYAYLGESVVGNFIIGPSIEQEVNGFPIYKVSGIYKDKNLSIKFTEDELLHYKPKSEYVNSDIYVYATTIDLIDDDFINNFYSGKYVNKIGMEIVIKYPKLELSYLGHVLVGEYDEGLHIDPLTVTLDGEELPDSYEKAFVENYGDDFLYFDQPINHVCYTYYPDIVEVFMDYFNIQIPESGSDEYLYFRTPFKGLDYSQYF